MTPNPTPARIRLEVAGLMATVAGITWLSLILTAITG